ncbi:uncharacterized protein LOC143184953, partial [Calliopsis andreniformis]|uniref:uncharacterized protein LOC143184953 n=1 Tax=Calliopsis andreniformis TaxID=337506 RepID=UPI003FCC767D
SCVRLRWPVKVNCWFCNNNAKIWRQQLNWWLCPHCDQYNGFSKNGDYLFNIPEQYKSPSTEIKKYCTVNQSTEKNKSAKNGLCKQCNTNETLKLSKLCNYTSENDKNYEHEIKQFKDNLEQQYPLCVKCKNKVKSILYKQTLWLAEYKMLLFRQKPFQMITNTTKYSEPIFRAISTILDSMIAYNMDLIFLPIGGLFFQLCACWVAPAKRKISDMLLMFLWICIIVLLPFKDVKLMKADLQHIWFPIEDVTQYHMIMILISVIGFINVKPRSHNKGLNKSMSFKKIESPTKDKELFDPYVTSLKNKYNTDTKITNDFNKTIASQSLLNATNDCMPFYTENSTNFKSPDFQSPLSNQESQVSSMTITDNSVCFNSTSLHKNNVSENYLLNDSLSTLSTLSLSDDKPKYSSKAPKIFETKVYNTKSSELFKKVNNISGRKSILSPPKLKSVTQASWVAGGYWYDGIDPPTLSRSSSQSSGFGSAGSNFAPSREPSIHEFDQCSVISDATPSCYNVRQNNISPVASYYQQSFQYPFSESQNSNSNQIGKFTSLNHCTPQTLYQNCQRSSPVLMDQSLQAQNISINNIKNPSEMQMFPSHTTIVTSPVWLPALLCGSVIVNIIVLCTTLLR